MSNTTAPPGPPGTYQPQPPPRKKRHRVRNTFLAIGGVIVVLIVASVLSSSGKPTSPASAPSAPGTPAPSAAASASAAPKVTGPGIGSKVRDGDFQFVVTRVTHAKSVGDTSLGLGETAQGKFTELHITVTNISSQAQTLDDSAQFLFDSRGRKFDADSTADIDANQSNGGGVFFNSINPGNTVHGVFLFDLPAGAKAVKAELHDSMFSGGVTVALRK